MAPVGASVLGERGTTPTVPRVGRTGQEAPAGRPGGSTRQSAPAVPWGNDRSPSRHGTHPGAGRAGFLLARNASRVSRICNECDCAMLKRLHQYVVGVPMERLAMDVAGPYPVT